MEKDYTFKKYKTKHKNTDLEELYPKNMSR